MFWKTRERWGNGVVCMKGGGRENWKVEGRVKWCCSCLLMVCTTYVKSFPVATAASPATLNNFDK